jgi:arginyl-tRNA--protein-N-Asp/Glu arginylyltransferase
MKKFNISIPTNTTDIENAYNQGMLPQRNKKGLFYFESSCRSRLSETILNSENKRIIRKTSSFSHTLKSQKDFVFDHQIQKNCHFWAKNLSWQFPTKSIKTVFTNHIFNYIYTWSHLDKQIAYAICLFTKNISHIAYVFYNPIYQKENLVNAMVLKTITDSQDKLLDYCYLGRFDPQKNIGYYKRDMPGFQVFNQQKQIWQTYKQYKQK